MSIQIKLNDAIFQRLAYIGLLIYPLVAHIGISMDEIAWVVCYLFFVIYINSVSLVSWYKLRAILFIILLPVLYYIFIKVGQFSFIIFLPPVLIPCWLAFIFIRSLKSNMAVISKIATRVEGKKLDARHLLYTRRLTILWSVAFLLMICEAIVLAVWAPFDIWSWWVHVGNYIIVAILFLIELSLRHYFIGKRTNFVQMLQIMLQLNWRK